MKKIISVVIGLCFTVCQAKELKIAVLDNPKIDSVNSAISEKLSKAYMDGLNTAIFSAKKSNIDVQYKTFFYGKNLVDLVYQVPRVMRWNPDAIVGLGNSNQLLMSESFFSDLLVLSLFATNAAIDNMPNNFYSLGVSDKYVSQKMVQFIHEHFPDKNIFMILESDARADFDMSNLLIKEQKAKYPVIKIDKGAFLSEDIGNVNIKKLLKNYHQGDIIVMMTLVYSQQIELMNKINAYLSPEPLVFFSCADNWQNRQIASQQEELPYLLYRIAPEYLDEKTSKYQMFREIFKEVNDTYPTEAVSYAIYRGIMSIVTAIKAFPAPKSLRGKEAVLYSYHQALKKDPNWFKPKKQLVYKVEKHGEILFEEIN